MAPNVNDKSLSIELLDKLTERVKYLETELENLKVKQQKDINDLDNSIDEENRLRDEKMNDYFNLVALLERFIEEKFAPEEWQKFINHVNSEPDTDAMSDTSSIASDISSVESDTSSVASDDSFIGGRKKKTRKRKKKRKRRQTKRKR